MHCVDPACAAACMLGSLKKDPITGVVVTYDPDYCVGCRFCMMACPFNVAKFEFDKAVPNIVKCELCRHRIKDAATVVDGFTRYPEGQGPACCEVCPAGSGDLRQARRAARRGQAPHRRTSRQSTSRTGSTARPRTQAEPRCSTCRTCRSRRSGCRRWATRACPTWPTRSRRASTGSCRSPRPVALYGALVAVAFRNRKGGGEDGGESKP